MSRPWEEEKANQVEYIEDQDIRRTATGETQAAYEGISASRERKLLLKIDLVILPILCILYACALLDRVNISSARVDGMGVTLGLLGKDNKYSIVLLVFFPAYFLFEVPSNVFLRRIGTRNWLAGLCLLFGAVSIAEGFVKSWITMAVCRVFLGAAEGGFFPGAVYLITCWYRRHEVQLRLTIFYMTGSLLSGFSGIIAYGIAKMGTTAGYESWRWIYILEGCATCFFAIVGFFVISDFPQEAKWLNNQERADVIARIEQDRHDAKKDHKIISLSETLKYCVEPQLWIYGLYFGCATTSTYALAYFSPVIIASMGYKNDQALILSSPPYIAAVFYALIVSYASDKTKMRGPFIVLNCLVVIIGLLLVSKVSAPHPRYAGVFLAVAGSSLNVPMCIGFGSNNIVDNGRRAVGTAIQTGWGAVGGIIASTIFRQADYPKYLPGLYTTIALTVLLAVGIICQSLMFNMRNQQANRGERVLWNMPDFRYTL